MDRKREREKEKKRKREKGLHVAGPLLSFSHFLFLPVLYRPPPLGLDVVDAGGGAVWTCGDGAGAERGALCCGGGGGGGD